MNITQTETDYESLKKQREEIAKRILDDDIDASIAVIWADGGVYMNINVDAEAMVEVFNSAPIAEYIARKDALPGKIARISHLLPPPPKMVPDESSNLAIGLLKNGLKQFQGLIASPQWESVPKAKQKMVLEFHDQLVRAIRYIEELEAN